MKLVNVVTFFKNNNISITVYNQNDFYSYKPASLKNIIEKGLYFVVGNISTSKIKNSLIITDHVPEEFNDNTYILVENPQLAFYKLLQSLKVNSERVIHETVIIHPKAKIGKNVSIGPFCVIEECEIHDNVELKNNITIYKDSVIKSNVFIDSNSCIGASGLAWIWDEKGKRVMQPQFGGVIIEENCYLGTDITIAKGSLSENTIIGESTVMSHGTKIGHGVHVEKNVHMANNVSLAGNAVIGERSFLGSASTISSNIRVPKNTIVGAGTLVNKVFVEEFLTLVGVPAKILKSNNYNQKPNGAPKPFKK